MEYFIFYRLRQEYEIITRKRGIRFLHSLMISFLIEYVRWNHMDWGLGEGGHGAVFGILANSKNLLNPLSVTAFSEFEAQNTNNSRLMIFRSLWGQFWDQQRWLKPLNILIILFVSFCKILAQFHIGKSFLRICGQSTFKSRLLVY